MPPTKQQVQAYIESKGKPYERSIDVALGMIKTAAVSFEHLTNNPEWDRFLSIVQEKLNNAKELRAHAAEYCLNAVRDEEMKAYQIGYAREDQTVKILEWIMGLPHQLKATHDELRERESQSVSG